MPGPIDSLRFVHEAILAEADAIEAAVAEAGSPADAGELAARVAYYGSLVDRHTRGEEIGLFPALAEKVPGLAEAYVFDHRDERELFEELAGLFERCAGGDADALSRLRRQVVALSEHVHSHVRKENELVLPLVHEHFTPPEQGAMVQKILSTIPPEDMQVAVPWIVSRLRTETAVAYVRVLEGAMPPPVFAAAKGWLRNGLSAERWGALGAEIPSLTV